MGSGWGRVEHEQHAQRVGMCLGGRLTLLRVLGVGGMAAVYEAVHRNGHRYAIKILHSRLALSESQRTRFRREAYVVNRIEHPGVVRIFDDGETEDGTPYLVLELLRGSTVGALLDAQAERRLDVQTVVDLADQLLEVLCRAHAAKVIHRDLKPENLFVVDGGALKVVDFGIARVFEQIDGASLNTQHGAVLGTPAFMAQEQARGLWAEVDERTDLWAVGATMFTMLAGEPVHSGRTSNEQLGRAMTVPARSLYALRSDLPPALIAVVDRALRFEPAERWSSALEMQQSLRLSCREAFPDLRFRSAIGAAPAPTLHDLAGPREGATTVGDSAAIESDFPRYVDRVGPRVWPSRLSSKQRSVVWLGLLSLILIGVFATFALERAPLPEPAVASAPPARAAASSSSAVEPTPVPQDVQDAGPLDLNAEAKSNAQAQPLAPAVSGSEPAQPNRPRMKALGRMVQGAAPAHEERRSPPDHVEPPDPFETRY